MRISTQEERQKQRYNRQEYALNKYAQGNDFEYVLGSVKMYPLKILLIASNEQILSGFFSLGILLFLKTSHALPGKPRQGMRST